ncbi:MAG: hypothetical protein ACTHQM_18370 [Thermoanaerobaculia bacterium]
MRKFILCSLLLFVALNAFGHAGEVHKYMGTVTTVHDDGSFMLKKTDGNTMHIVVAKNTSYVHANGSAAKASELAAGKRVVVTVAKDGRTASEVKLAAAKKS